MNKIIFHRLLALLIFILIISLLIIFEINNNDKIISKSPVNISGLVGYWSFDKVIAGKVIDQSTTKNNGTLYNVKIVNNSAYFNGVDSKIEIKDNNAYSVTTTGQLTIGFWIKFQTFNFTNPNNTYVNFMGKGDNFYPPNQEWAFRVYSNRNPTRARHISFYVFNLSGGFGVGSTIPKYEPVNKWLFIVGKTDGKYTYIYQNGTLIDKDPYSAYGIIPQNGNSSLNIGWRDPTGGYFKGYMNNIMIFNRALSNSEIMNLYETQKKYFQN